MSLTSLNASKKRAASMVAIALSGALVLSACSDSGKDKKDSSAASSAAESSAAKDGASEANDNQELKISDAYVTAKSTEKSMTAAFGTLHNGSDKDISISEVKGDIEGADYQLHTVDKDGKMKQVSEFVIPAGEDKVLEPGGDHIMIMEVKEELSAGDSLNLTLVDKDGEEYKLDNIPVRVQQSTHEHYDHSGGEKSGENGAEKSGEMDGMHDHEHMHEHNH